ncbi:MAG: dUTP diphosphatase [Caldisericia bacterium]|nr:dUTP diphosphatase [Caldisericia bacterium]
MKRIKFYKLQQDAILPKYAHEEDAGMDMYSIEDVTLKPGEWKKVGCGIQVEIPVGYFGALAPRSGLALKKGVTLLNSWGVIDSGYRGEVCAIVINESKVEVHLQKLTRIAQLIILPFEKAIPTESKEPLSISDRGNGGFGSTGI